MVSKGMFPVKYFRSNKASFCDGRISWRSEDCHKVGVNLATLIFEDATGLEQCCLCVPQHSVTALREGTGMAVDANRMK